MHYIAQEDRLGQVWTDSAGWPQSSQRAGDPSGNTQQVIKNTYLTQNRLTRKIVEILLAPEIERNSNSKISWSSTAIPLYGHQVRYGVEAASFRVKHAADLVYGCQPWLHQQQSLCLTRIPSKGILNAMTYCKACMVDGGLSDDEYSAAYERPLR